MSTKPSADEPGQAVDPTISEPSRNSPTRFTKWTQEAVIGVSTTLGVTAAIAQLLDFMLTGKTNTVAISAIITLMAVTSLYAAYLLREERRRRKDQKWALTEVLNVIFAILASLALAVPCAVLLIAAMRNGAQDKAPITPTSTTTSSSTSPPAATTTTASSPVTTTAPTIAGYRPLPTATSNQRNDGPTITTSTTTPNPQSAGGPQPARVTFLTPSPSTMITHGQNVHVSGTATGIGEYSLWLVTRPDAGEGYYTTSNTPLTIEENGNWNFEDPEVGDATDSGNRITYIAILADTACNNSLRSVDTVTKELPASCKNIASTYVNVR